MCHNSPITKTISIYGVHLSPNLSHSESESDSLVNCAYLGCVAVRSPGGLLHPQAHGGDRSLRDLDRVDHLLRRLVHHVEAAHGAESKPRPTRFTESIGPFSCLSCFQTWKKNSVSFAVLFCVSERRTMIGTGLVLLSLLQVWQVSRSHTWRHETRKPSHITGAPCFLGLPGSANLPLVSFCCLYQGPLQYWIKLSQLSLFRVLLFLSLIPLHILPTAKLHVCKEHLNWTLWNM